MGETSALHSAPICTVFARLLRPLLVLQCPRYSGRMKIIAAIESPEVACRILDSLGTSETEQVADVESGFAL
jgi:hypothetical protein